MNIIGEQDCIQYLLNSIYVYLLSTKSLIFDISDFTIYCENKHVCKYEDLIEEDAVIYATGDLYNLVDTDFSKKGSPVKIGPILSWERQGREFAK